MPEARYDQKNQVPSGSHMQGRKAGETRITKARVELLQGEGFADPGKGQNDPDRSQDDPGRSVGDKREPGLCQ